MLDERSTEILKLLVQTDDYVTLDELTQRLGISRRTVYYDMNKINDWLETLELPPVEYVRTAGYSLPEASRRAIPDTAGAESSAAQQYYLSQRERLAWIAIRLLTAKSPVFIHRLTELLQVSRGTVLKDLNAVRAQLETAGLDVVYDRKRGYEVHGEEARIRRELTRCCDQLAGSVSWEQAVSRTGYWGEQDPLRDIMPENTDEGIRRQIYRLIAASEQMLNVELTDEMLFHLTTRFLLFIRRIQSGRVIRVDEDEREVLRQTPEYDAASRIADGLVRLFGSPVPEEENAYLTMHLLGARANRMEQLTGSDEIIGRLRDAAREMTDAFQRSACVWLGGREAVEEDLLVHLKPAYYRIIYGLELVNPLLEDIRSKYGDLFELTRRSAYAFEELVGRKLSDVEISYLAMHFGGWLRREEMEPAARRRAAIVCVNGISASRMLKAQLEGLFSTLDIIAMLSLREYEQFQERVDLIFSTVPLPDSKVPVYVVHSILSDKDKENLLGRVNKAGGRGQRTQASSLQALLDIVRKHADVTDEAGLADELGRYLSGGRSKVWLGERPKPSLAELLPAPMIRLQQESPSWREAIREAAQPLLAEEYIDEGYIDAMIGKVESLGPYIVVAPGIAIAHGRPEDGVKRLGMSLLQLERPVAFSGEARHQVKVVLVLAAIDGESHLKALSELTGMLKDAAGLNRLKEAHTKEQILKQIGTASSSG